MTTKTNILFIEDEEELRNILKKVIEREGYAVDVARTGQGSSFFIRLPCLRQ